MLEGIKVCKYTFFNLYSLSSSEMFGSAESSSMIFARWAAAPSNSSCKSSGGKYRCSSVSVLLIDDLDRKPR